MMLKNQFILITLGTKYPFIPYNILMFKILILVLHILQVNAQANVLLLKLGFVNPNLNYIWSNGDTSTKQFNLSVNYLLNNITISNFTTPATVNNLILR